MHVLTPHYRILPGDTLDVLTCTDPLALLLVNQAALADIFIFLSRIYTLPDNKLHLVMLMGNASKSVCLRVPGGKQTMIYDARSPSLTRQMKPLLHVCGRVSGSRCTHHRSGAWRQHPLAAWSRPSLRTRGRSRTVPYVGTRRTSVTTEPCRHILLRKK
jgi:hypothetical protein